MRIVILIIFLSFLSCDNSDTSFGDSPVSEFKSVTSSIFACSQGCAFYYDIFRSIRYIRKNKKTFLTKSQIESFNKQCILRCKEQDLTEFKLPDSKEKIDSKEKSEESKINDSSHVTFEDLEDI